MSESVSFYTWPFEELEEAFFIAIKNFGTLFVYDFDFFDWSFGNFGSFTDSASLNWGKAGGYSLLSH